MRSSAPLAKLRTGLNWLLFNKGAAATTHFHVGGYVRSRPDLEQPDIQLCFIPLSMNFNGSNLASTHGFMAETMLLRPTSMGRIKLKTNNPTDAPSILFNYLSTDHDQQGIYDSARVMREMFAQKAFDPYRGRELAPGAEHQSKEQILTYASQAGTSVYHPCGSCKMGIDDEAVVDDELRVHGIEGLRVVDASIMPKIPSCNLNAPVIMIAEKTADMIAGNEPLEPLYVPVYRPESAAASAH